MTAATEARLEQIIELSRRVDTPSMWFIRELAERALADERSSDAREFNAHTLTLKFHRFLSQDEWRLVAERAAALPFVQEMDANAVQETTDA